MSSQGGSWGLGSPKGTRVTGGVGRHQRAPCWDKRAHSPPLHPLLPQPCPAPDSTGGGHTVEGMWGKKVLGCQPEMFGLCAAPQGSSRDEPSVCSWFCCSPPGRRSQKDREQGWDVAGGGEAPCHAVPPHPTPSHPIPSQPVPGGFGKQTWSHHRPVGRQCKGCRTGWLFWGR